MYSVSTYRAYISTVEVIETVGMVDGGEADSIKVLRYVD
jgi:hypothetical protein